MYIAMPVKTKREDTALSPLFGHAKYFAFVHDGVVTIEENPFDGGVAVVEWLLEKGVDTIVTQHIGAKPFMLLAAKGVRCYFPGDGRITIDEAIVRLEKGACEAIGAHNIERFARHSHKAHERKRDERGV